MFSLKANNEQNKWVFLQLQFLRRDYVTFCVQDGKLSISFTDGSWAESNGHVEMKLQDIIVCQCRPCLSFFQLFWVSTSLFLALAGGYMLTEYHGWREGSLNDVLSILCVVLFGFASIWLATKQRTIMIQTEKFTIKATLIDAPLLGRKSLRGLMECLQQAREC